MVSGYGNEAGEGTGKERLGAKCDVKLLTALDGR